MKLSKASAAVVVIQLLLVGSIAAKYYYQRAICPRVWTRAAMYDPELMMRGRYLSMQLQVDGCQSALPFAVQPRIPGVVGRVRPRNSFAMVGPVYTARIGVKGNQLVAARIAEDGDLSSGEQVSLAPGQSCDAIRLLEPVAFYIPEKAVSPLPVQKGQELWVEVTVPPKGPPRPIQLALKDNGNWKPLAFQ